MTRVDCQPEIDYRSHAAANHSLVYQVRRRTWASQKTRDLSIAIACQRGSAASLGKNFNAIERQIPCLEIGNVQLISQMYLAIAFHGHGCDGNGRLYRSTSSQLSVCRHHPRTGYEKHPDNPADEPISYQRSLHHHSYENPLQGGAEGISLRGGSSGWGQ